jgi:DNA processing protein
MSVRRRSARWSINSAAPISSHTASLDNGTSAVVAGGIDIVYPPENADLQAAIGERGLLISERAPGYAPRAKDFPRRNRLISGIALGVVVIEAAQRSGSLITARMAGEQGREVFAVPGSTLDPRAAGTNNLLKQGAPLVTGPEDIIEALAPMLGCPAPGPRELSSHGEQEVPRPLPDIGQTERDRVIEALGPSPIYIDEIIRCTGIETRKVHIILLELDLAGRLQRLPRQLVSLIDRDADQSDSAFFRWPCSETSRWNTPNLACRVSSRRASVP